MSRLLLAVPVVFLLGGLAACDDQSMRQQKRYDAYAAAKLWPDGTAARSPPPGAVAQEDGDRHATIATPPAVTRALLDRGRERHDIYCAPCHGRDGDGNGMVVQRGFPKPPSYHGERLRSASASHILDVITDGYGVMYGQASQIDPPDRWAITAYLRALQLSRQADVAAVPGVAKMVP